MSNSDFVLVGFIEQKDEVGTNINSNSVWRENFIGGEPVFSPNLSQEGFQNNFSQQHLTCGDCGQVIAFITQMNCPVDSKPVDRVIYIFSCVNVNCKNRSWKIFRVVTPVKDEDMKDGSGDNHKESESMETDGDVNVVPGAPLRLLVKQNVSKFKAMYLSVEEEQYLLGEDTNGRNNKSKNVAIEAKSTEVYEKFLIPGTDEVANKFLKTVSKFSRQVIRYEWNGKPLLNQDVKIRPSNCSGCGSKRTFELQIMPGLICEMKPLVEEEPIELDYGTILFFTCKNNCNNNGNVYVEESIVLNDPDSGIMPTF